MSENENEVKMKVKMKVKMSENENEVKMKVKMKNSITNRESIKIYSEEKKIVIYVFYKIPKLDKTVSSWKKNS